MVTINIMSSKHNHEKRVIHSNRGNIEIMINDKEDEVIEKTFESLLSRYQIGLEASIKGSNFTFDYVDFLYYKCHKISFKRGGSYIDSPD